MTPTCDEGNDPEPTDYPDMAWLNQASAICCSLLMVAMETASTWAVSYTFRPLKYRNSITCAFRGLIWAKASRASFSARKSRVRSGRESAV